MFNATFNNISDISWQSVLLVEEIVVPGENISKDKDVYEHDTFSYSLRVYSVQGRIQDFKLGGAHLKKLRRAEGGAKIFGVFRVKNHDFTPKKSYFFRLRREARNFLRYFV